MKRIMLLVALMACSLQAEAIVVNWTDWLSSDNTHAYGQIVVGGTTVNVTLTAANFGWAGVQTGTGANYWTEPNPASPPYTGGIVSNAPPAAEEVTLNSGGIVTIAFSQAINNPFIAINSWNGNTVDFGEPINFVSYGQGYWGAGTPIMNGTGTGFYGSGEVHGIIALNGPHNSISFTHTSENWHGLTIGVPGLASVPSAGILSLLGFGLAGMVLACRARRH